MYQGSHLPGTVVSARVVSARSAKGCVDLTELAAAESWSPAPLEMVGFSLPESVRQSRQCMLAQYRGRFQDVRLVAGMAGIGDIANGEYVCDGVFDNLGRVNIAWYEKHGLRIDDSGVCAFFAGKGESLQVANAISFFGWENGNYAHWLSEKLGRFFWIEQAGLPDDTVVLVEAGLPASIMDSLALFWPRERTLCVSPGSACQVAVLHHFSDTADIWEPRAGYVYRGDEYHLYPPAIAWMASQVKARCAVVEGHDKAYLIRPPGGNGRTIVNQQELIRELSRDGFQALQPEVCDFASQVRALAGCELAILGSGAAAANLLWMPRGGTLVMLIQDNPQMWYWFFHALAAAVGVRLVYHPVKGLPGTHSVVYHWNVEIPIGALRQWLAQDALRASQALPEQPLGVETLQSELAGRRRRTLPEPLSVEPQKEGVDVTVAVMSYNNAAFLAQTLDSVLAQEGVRLEVVVYDDCSKDDSLEVLKRYAGEPRLHFEVNTQNLGMTGNYNKCVAAGRGRYVVVLGSDDVLYPGHLASLVEAMDASPQAALGYTQCYWIDEQGTRQQYADHPGHRRASYCGGRDEVIDLLCFDNYITPSAAMLRRSALHVVALPEGGIHRHDMLAGDWELWIRLARVAPDFIFLRQPSVGYRVHGGQISKSFYGSDRPLREHTEILEMCLEDAPTRARMRAAAQPIWQLYRQRFEAYMPEVKATLQVRSDAIRRALQEQSPCELDALRLFSVILTTYNRPDLLRDALASVGNQTLRDFEVILVNDNGEPVEHLLAAYDFPITYIRQGRNQGLSAARNAGLKQARGRYIVYLDDDDVYLSSHLAVLSEAFEQYPDSVIYTGVEYVNEEIVDGKRVERGRSRPFEHQVFDCDRLFVQNYIPVNTWAHPRSMLAEIGEFDTELTAFEDWDLLLRLAARYPFVHIPKVTAEVHLRGAPNTGSDHMLGREQKNFGSLYQEMYRRHSDLDSDVVRAGRRAILESFGVSDLSNNHQSASLADWLEMRALTPTQERLVKERLEKNGQGPSFGVLILDLEADRQEVLRTLASLRKPTNFYENIEPVVFTKSESFADFFGAEVVSVTSANWILQINEYSATASFDWLLLVKAGDEFTAGGLLMAGLELLGTPANFRAIYGDELYRQDDGTLGAAFRPSMNLDYLLSFPAGMAKHWIFHRETLVHAGGFDPAFPEALELELILRLINLDGLAGLGHVDEPLLITSAPALESVEEEQRAIIRHLHERGYQSASIDSSLPGRYLIKYGHVDRRLVSILIPVEDNLAMLLRCVTSIMESTGYVNYEILLLDGGGSSREICEWLGGIESMAEQRIRVLRFSRGSSREAICNQAAKVANGDYLVLLSQFCAVISEVWLDEMLNHALRPEVGIVGSELISKESFISHAGLVLGLRGPATSPFEGETLSAAGYMQRLQVEQNYSAVSSDCLMISKELWNLVGGLDEAELSGTLAGVDLCLRAREAGFLTVWSPRVKMMIGRESKAPKVEEADALYARWLPLLARDPAYNANFSLVQPGGFKLADTALSWRPLATWRPLPVILAHPADQFGCGHYRVMQPFKAQQDAGLIDGALSMGLMHVTDLERYDPDVILLQRQIGEERLEAMRRMKAFSRAFKVYELDDYLPNLPMKSAHKQHMPKDIVKSLRKGLSYVDRFVVSTEALADAFAGFHHDIRVVENKLPPNWWQGLQGQRRVSKRPRVGWAGGAGHAGDLELIADVVKALADEVDWIFFGMCPEKLRPYVKEFHAGVAIDLYPAALARLNLDLALAPLEQNLFNECKSNLRLLEYGACGFPVICSDVGNYRGGLPVTRVKNRFRDWVDAIRMHLADLDASARQGDELRSAVLSSWMLQDAALTEWRTAWLPSSH